ncbi:CsgG/HfaB family protein [Intestinicryptomonas porci]|uniref:CsgG/HfaB family protein n=1 Tax=Intestinicryptomonas porci TaxID=2926320 RepID=A0ABU4WFA9_9BACT|nr:CsgG/HfaB family protein [Opitutales bacterium CLA-KB-P66]
MKHTSICLLAIMTSLTAFAAPETVAKKTSIAVTKVVVTKSLENSLKAKGGAESLSRVVESMNSNLSSAFLSTRKFDVLTRTDLDALVAEQQFGESGNVDSKTAPQAGKFKGAQYIVTVAIDDYKDYMRKRNFGTLNKITETRIIRFGAVANLIDATTGSIKESTNFIISNEGRAEEDSRADTSSGDLTDSVIATLTRSMCNNIAFKISDIIYPAKIIGKTGKTIMFNRAADSGVKLGDVYEVFALGEVMIDPDTGETLGSEETLIGTIKVISVLPKFSKGVIVGEDNGIEKGQVLRLKENPKPEKSDTQDEEEL